MLGVVLLRPNSVEMSAWGAAGLAGLGAGVWGDRDELGKLRGAAGDTFTRVKEWDNMKEYRRWVNACRRFTRWNVEARNERYTIIHQITILIHNRNFAI